MKAVKRILLKSVLTALKTLIGARFHGLRQFIAFISMVVSGILIVIPWLEPILDSVSLPMLYQTPLVVGGLANVVNEFLNTWNTPDPQKEKERLRKEKLEQVQLLLVLLNEVFEWSAKCRVTVFGPTKNSDNEHCITPIERIGAGVTPGIDNERVFFRIGEGIPGKAWKDTWSGNDPNDILRAFYFGRVPKELLNKEKEDVLRGFYKEKFNVSGEQFEVLSSEKYQITSYMAVGILNQNKSLSVVLVFDTDDETLFHDYKELSGISKKDTIKQTSLMVRTENGGAPKDVVNMADSVLDQIPPEIKEMFTSFLKKPREKGHELLKEANSAMAILSSVRKMSIPTPDLKSALLPFTWVLRTIRLLLGENR